MIVFYSHLSWFVFLFSGLILSVLSTLSVLWLNESISLSFILFDISSLSFSVSFHLDWISTSFISTVLLISSVIMIYSYNYIAPYSNSPYFLWITVLFILSMLFVVTMSNLFFIMLGWDGLGLVSFFLIVYYQNSSSIFSGMFTLLMNRIGDCFFLVSIALFFYSYPFLFPTSSTLASDLVVIILIITFMTNSAIYPFSPWLPLAMAAPTPISALVHSSTLVTAGLYLMMRYSYLVYSSYWVINALLICSLFTSFYAGLNAVFEVDLNKLIALSTLSHLGFIGMAFSVGLLHLAFFHLLAHALFNSLLFITIGDIMINLNHSQDIRYLSSGMSYTPASSILMYVSLFNLLGLPNLSGFFSNDLILEIVNFSNSSFLATSIIYFNIVFTYFYTYQLFYYTFQSSNVLPYQLFHSLAPLHILLMGFIALSTLVFGFLFMKLMYWTILFYPLPTVLKLYPPLLMMGIFVSLFLFKNQVNFRSPLAHYYFSNMMFLSNFIITLCSNFYYSALFPLTRSLELGALNYLANGYLSRVVTFSSTAMTLLVSLPPINVVLFITPSLSLLLLLLYVN